ncbi:MAG: DNA polymerase III subunit delta [Oscillospiraceae bacterium]|nr:DNA polymerase III subunit delta [Oscillospiraceae bacterium]
MRLEKEPDLIRHLKDEPCLPVYLLYGQQSYLVRLYAKKLREKAVSSAQMDLNFTYFEAARTSVDEVSDALESVPFSGGIRCVQLTDLDADKLSANEWAKLKERMAGFPQDTVLILSQQNVPVDAKKSARWKAILKAVELSGAVIVLDGRSRRETVRFLSALCQKNGCTIAPALCETLIDRCGDDMLVLGQEIQKLCAYQGEGEIPAEAVERLSIRQLDANVFDLARRILGKDLSGALENLQELFDMGSEPVAVLGALNTSFIDLYRCKTAREQGLSAADVTAAFSYKGREFRVRNAMRDTDRFSRRRLARCVFLLADTDFRLKSSRTDPQILMQEAVTRLFLALHQQEGGL